MEGFSIGGMRVVWVDGDEVRASHDDEFYRGANPFACWYVPDGELWLDRGMPAGEPLPIACHELWEAGQMRNFRKGYDGAHRRAELVERKVREAMSPGSDARTADGMRRALLVAAEGTELDELAAWLREMAASVEDAR